MGGAASADGMEVLEADVPALRKEIEATKRLQQDSLSAVRELRKGQEELKAFLAQLRVDPAEGQHHALGPSGGNSSADSRDLSPTDRMSDLNSQPECDGNQPEEFKLKAKDWVQSNVHLKKLPSQSRNLDNHEKAAESETNLPYRRSRQCAHWVVHSMPGFDAIVGLAIVANSLTIGLEIQWELDNMSDQAMQTLDHIESGFIAFYTLEVILRLLADGRENFQSRWFQMDFGLVCVGLLTQCVVKPLLMNPDSIGVQVMGQVLIIRMLRLLRLVRALRTLHFFIDLWKLVNGMLGSVRTVLSACFLIVGFGFVFACVGVEAITKNDVLQENEETKEIVDYRFNSLPLAMLTLMQFSCADSIGEIYAPLIVQCPWLLVFFLAIFLIFTIALMNLVTAVIVEHAIECSQIDKEMERNNMRKKLKKLEPVIYDAFKLLDENGNGKISICELKLLEFQNKMLPKEIADIVSPDKLADLFEFLDADDSGEIDKEEFVDGISYLALSNTAIETTQCLQLLRDSRRSLQAIARDMYSVPTLPKASESKSSQEFRT